MITAVYNWLILYDQTAHSFFLGAKHHVIFLEVQKFSVVHKWISCMYAYAGTSSYSKVESHNIACDDNEKYFKIS